MKIIMTDNFNRENHSEVVVAIGIENPIFANAMRDALNAAFGGEDSSMYFVVRKDDEKEYIFVP